MLDMLYDFIAAHASPQMRRISGAWIFPYCDRPSWGHISDVDFAHPFRILSGPFCFRWPWLLGPVSARIHTPYNNLIKYRTLVTNKQDCESRTSKQARDQGSVLLRFAAFCPFFYFLFFILFLAKYPPHERSIGWADGLSSTRLTSHNVPRYLPIVDEAVQSKPDG